jgi:TRAP-type C4-dicarboxylate transport system permease small subunit
MKAAPKTLGRPDPHRAVNMLGTCVSRLLGGALLLAVVINFVNIISRYVFNRSLAGVDEVQIYLMIGMTFLGGLTAHICRQHLRMDVLNRYFPPLVARLIEATEALLMIAICALMTCISWNYTVRIFNIGSHSENANIPMWVPHGVLVLSFSLMTLVSLVRLCVRDAQDMEDPPIGNDTMPNEPLAS